MEINGNKGSLKYYLFNKFINSLNFVLKRKKKLFNNNIKKILIIKGDHIGDTIISTICLKPLKENYPNSEIDILCGSWGKKTYEYQNKIRKIYLLDHIFLNRRKQSYITKLLLFIKQLKNLIPILKAEKYDLCILLRGQARGSMALVAALIAPKYMIGFEGIGLENLLDYKEKYSNFIPEKDNFLNLLEEIPNFKIKNRNLKYEIILPKNIELEQKIIRDSKFNIIINIEGHDYNRKLSNDKVIEFLIYYKDKDVNIYLITPPNSKEIKKIEEKLKKMMLKNTTILDEVGDLFYLLNYFKSCDLLITVDTSILHLATVELENIIGIYNNQEKSKKFAPNVINKYIVIGEKDSIRNINMKEVIKLTNKIIMEKNKCKKY